MREVKVRHVNEVKSLQEQLDWLTIEHNNDQLTITQLCANCAPINNDLTNKNILSVEYAKQSEELKRLQSEVVQLLASKEEMIKLKLHYDQLNAEVATCKNNELEVREIASQWKQTCDQKNQEIIKLKSDIQQMLTTEAKAKDQFSQYDAQIRELKEELDKSRQNSQQHLLEIKRVNTSQEQAHEECKTLKKENDRLKSERTKLTEEKKSLEMANNTLTKRAAELKSQQLVKPPIQHNSNEVSTMVSSTSKPLISTFTPNYTDGTEKISYSDHNSGLSDYRYDPGKSPKLSHLALTYSYLSRC